MVRVKSIDVIVFAYTLYFAVTLALEQDMLSGENEVYIFMSRIMPHEVVWGFGALFISVVYAFSFWLNGVKWISVTASLLGGLFFILLGSAYMLTYPNIGSGLYTIVGVICFMNIATLTITKEKVEKDLERMVEHDESENP